MDSLLIDVVVGLVFAGRERLNHGSASDPRRHQVSAPPRGIAAVAGHRRTRHRRRPLPASCVAESGLYLLEHGSALA